MSNQDSAADQPPDFEARSLELLGHAVLDELQAMNAFREYGIADEILVALADDVTSRIEYAFEVRWSPNWVKAGEPHVWQEVGEWRARCNICMAESPLSPFEREVRAWFDEHVEVAHPRQELE